MSPAARSAAPAPEVMQRLEDLASDVKEIREILIELREQAKNDHELVVKHERALYPNNGNQGLIAQMLYLTRVAGAGVWAAGLAVAFLLTTALGAFVYLVVTHPMSLP